MPTGTPLFQPERLREAREANGLTQAALAEIAGVTRQAISQYESGRDTPVPTRLPELARALGVTPRFFLEAAPSADRSTVFYRRLFSPSTKTARRRADRRLEWFTQLMEYFGRYAALPPVNFPPVLSPPDPSEIGGRDIEGIASEARRFWGLGDRPISNLVWLVENNGGLVVRAPLDHRALDAFSEWSSRLDRPVFVLGSDKDSACRSRFDVAHELGHMLLHAGVPDQTTRRPEIHKVLEQQAHRFAGAFLLPAEEFVDLGSTGNLELYLAWKPAWRVSIGAMIHRAGDLDLVSDEDLRRLWTSYSRRGYRKREPLDDQIEPEQARLPSRMLSLLLSEGVLGAEEIEYDTALLRSTVEQLLGVPDGFMNAHEDSASVISLTAHQRSAATGQRDLEGQVLQFRRPSADPDHH